MKYSVTVFESVDRDDAEEQARATWHHYDGLSLSKAWRIASKHARRGVNRFGGSIDKANWGIRGGNFPHNYRSATIRLDTF